MAGWYPTSHCARRGGPQRWPVPERSRGADQLPVHGAHVPLCGGPGAYAEGHGRSRSQQVSCSYCFTLLNWSRLLWPVQQVSPVWCTREVCSTQIACYWFPSSCPWLQQDPCSHGCPSHHPCALGNRQPWSARSSSQEDFTSELLQPAPPSTALPSWGWPFFWVFTCSFSCS